MLGPKPKHPKRATFEYINFEKFQLKTNLVPFSKNMYYLVPFSKKHPCTVTTVGGLCTVKQEAVHFLFLTETNFSETS